MAAPRSPLSDPQLPSGKRLPGRAALLGFLHDLAKLRKPVTAAAVAATLISLLSPFGINVGPDGAKVTALLTAIGVLAGILEHARKG